MPLFYIHNCTCISAQRTFLQLGIDGLNAPVNNKLEAIEPDYKGIPAGVLRRMGKAVRMGVGAALPLISDKHLDGVIIGTANGGMEDCIKFLNQLIDYDEGKLTPGNFVQSTPNAVAAQIGLLNRAKGYNITHAHGGLSFENALIDAGMMVNENPTKTYLVGGFDEISTYNYNIDFLAGWYKTAPFSGDLYATNSAGSIAGEGVGMFVVNDNSSGALAQLDAVSIFHTKDAVVVEKRLEEFLQKHLVAEGKLDLLITGENGDNRFTDFYSAAESLMEPATPIARYKHFSGEFPTSSAVALWLAIQILNKQQLPRHFIKKAGATDSFNKILVYNNFKDAQHSLLLVSLPK